MADVSSDCVSSSPLVILSAEDFTISDTAEDAVAENVSLICCCTVVAPVSVIFGAMAFFFSLT